MNAAQSLSDHVAKRARSESGLETLEYVLIAVAIIIGAYLAYQALGTRISGFLKSQIICKFDASQCGTITPAP